MRKQIRRLSITFIICCSLMLATSTVLVSGCQAYMQEDGTVAYRIPKSIHKPIQDAGDAATGILGILSMFMPALVPVATAVGAGTVVWKKMGTKVTKFQDPLTMLITVLESIKETDQATWSIVKAQIKEQHPTVNVDGTILEIKTELMKLKTLSANTSAPV